MKLLFLTILFAVAFASSASAQMKDWHAERAVSSAPPAETIDGLTRQMANKLHLNEGQYIHLRAANEIKLTTLEQIEWQYSDVAKRNTRTVELEDQYEAECRRILTPTQLSLYHEEYQRGTTPTKTGPKENGVG